jgi:hypothetical protein
MCLHYAALSLSVPCDIYLLLSVCTSVIFTTCNKLRSLYTLGPVHATIYLQVQQLTSPVAEMEYKAFHNLPWNDNIRQLLPSYAAGLGSTAVNRQAWAVSSCILGSVFLCNEMLTAPTQCCLLCINTAFQQLSCNPWPAVCWLEGLTGHCCCCCPASANDVSAAAAVALLALRTLA